MLIPYKTVQLPAEKRGKIGIECGCCSALITAPARVMTTTSKLLQDHGIRCRFCRARHFLAGMDVTTIGPSPLCRLVVVFLAIHRDEHLTLDETCDRMRAFRPYLRPRDIKQIFAKQPAIVNCGDGTFKINEQLYRSLNWAIKIKSKISVERGLQDAFVSLQ